MAHAEGETYHPARTGDTQIFSRTALYKSDCADFYRKWMRDMRNSQREDGAYPDIAPFPNFWGYGTAASPTMPT